NAPTTTAGTFYYRVQVVDQTSGCETPASEEVTVVVRPDAQISATVDNAEVCIGGSATLTAVLSGGSSSATLQWESSETSGGTFTPISGETNTTYHAPTTTAGTTFYRVR